VTSTGIGKVMTKYCPSCANLEDNKENLKLHKDSDASKTKTVSRI
jgi:hypothetical protein